MAIEPVGRSIERLRSWRERRTIEAVGVQRIERGGRLHVDSEIAEYASERNHRLALRMAASHNRTTDDIENLKVGRPVEDQIRLDEIRANAQQTDLLIQATFARRATEA